MKLVKERGRPGGRGTRGPRSRVARVAGVAGTDDFSIAGKRVLVTGGTAGIGRAVAEHFAGLRYLSRGDTVIVTSSVAALMTGPGFFEYSSSKAAANMVVRAAALELGPRGVRVNAVLPGVVLTDMSENDASALQTLTASGVVRRPEELAGVFHFLASGASQPVTGATIQADDGVSAGYSTGLLNELQ